MWRFGNTFWTVEMIEEHEWRRLSFYRRGKGKEFQLMRF